jgi:hypothetical protein
MTGEQQSKNSKNIPKDKIMLALFLLVGILTVLNVQIWISLIVVFFIAVILFAVPWTTSKTLPKSADKVQPSTAKKVKTTDIIGAISWLVVGIGFIYLLLVIFVPIFNVLAYAWSPTETFSGNQLHNKGYNIDGNCIIKQGALFVNGKCEIKKDVVDRVPYVMFDVINGGGNVVTVLRDKHPEVGSRNIVFGPTGIVTTRREVYLAQTRWDMNNLAYYPEVQVGKKRFVYDRPSYHEEPRDYTIEIKFNGRFIIDNIKSPYSSIEWKLNPFQ